MSPSSYPEEPPRRGTRPTGLLSLADYRGNEIDLRLFFVFFAIFEVQ